MCSVMSASHRSCMPFASTSGSTTVCPLAGCDVRASALHGVEPEARPLQQLLELSLRLGLEGLEQLAPELRGQATVVARGLGVGQTSRLLDQLKPGAIRRIEQLALAGQGSR